MVQMLGNVVVVKSIDSFDPWKMSVHTIPNLFFLWWRSYFTCTSRRTGNFLKHSSSINWIHPAFLFYQKYSCYREIVRWSGVLVTTVSNIVQCCWQGFFCVSRPCCPPGVGSTPCWMTLTWWSAATCPASPTERRRDTSSARYSIL